MNSLADNPLASIAHGARGQAPTCKTQKYLCDCTPKGDDSAAISDKCPAA